MRNNIDNIIILNKNVIIFINNLCLCTGYAGDTFDRSYGKVMPRNEVNFDVSKILLE